MLKQKLKELVSACFTGVWIESFEFQEVIGELTGQRRASCRRYGSTGSNSCFERIRIAERHHATCDEQPAQIYFVH